MRIELHLYNSPAGAFPLFFRIVFVSLFPVLSILPTSFSCCLLYTSTAPTDFRHLRIPEGAGLLSLHRSVRQVRQDAFLQGSILRSYFPDRRLVRAILPLAGNPALFHHPKDTACRDGTARIRIPVQRRAEAAAPLQPDRIEGLSLIHI